jgi:hypothetical protein
MTKAERIAENAALYGAIRDLQQMIRQLQREYLTALSERQHRAYREILDSIEFDPVRD